MILLRPAGYGGQVVYTHFLSVLCVPGVLCGDATPEKTLSRKKPVMLEIRPCLPRAICHMISPC